MGLGKGHYARAAHRIFLKQTVRRIYEAIKVTENRLYVEFPQIVPMLPEEIHFITAQRLLDLYPDKTPKEREAVIPVARGPCSSWASALRCRTDGLTTAAQPLRRLEYAGRGRVSGAER